MVTGYVEGLVFQRHGAILIEIYSLIVPFLSAL